MENGEKKATILRPSFGEKANLLRLKAMTKMDGLEWTFAGGAVTVILFGIGAMFNVSSKTDIPISCINGKEANVALSRVIGAKVTVPNDIGGVDVVYHGVDQKSAFSAAKKHCGGSMQFGSL